MNRTTMYLAAGLVGLLWWQRRQPPRASATAPAQAGWMEHAPNDPSNWYGDMWQRLQSGDLFGKVDAVHPVPTANPATQNTPVGYYVDPTNASGSFLNANVAPNAYGATVGGDPMQALFGVTPA